MVRRSRRKPIRRVRRAFPKRRSTRRKGTSSIMASLLGAVGYGAVRGYMNNLLAPLTAKVPLGAYADEAVLLSASYLIAKGKIPFLNKVKITRDIGKAGMMIEGASIGQMLMSGVNTGSISTSNQLIRTVM